MRYRRSRAKGSTFFFTVVTFQRKKILCNEQNVPLIEEAFRHTAGNRVFTVDAFVLLPDHIHCIWTLPEGDNDFSTRWRLIKSFFSRRCERKYKGSRPESRVRKREQAVWQRRFWEHRIRDERDFERHVDYIHYNPVKHGLAASPEAWPYSSFHRYVRKGLYSVDWGAGAEIRFDGGIGKE